MLCGQGGSAPSQGWWVEGLTPQSSKFSGTIVFMYFLYYIYQEYSLK